MVGGVSRRGTDPATERRRLRPSDDGDDPVGRLLEAIFWVSAEAFFFGLPTLAWTMLYGDVAETFVVAAALSALCLAGGIVRSRGGASGRGSWSWPPMTARLAAFRLPYYNAALAGAAAAGLTVATESVVRVAWASDPLLGPAAVAALLAGAAAALLPRIAFAVDG